MDILKIKDLEIPIEIKNYKNSKSVKIYFKGNILQINKPTRLSKKTLTRILKDEEDVVKEIVDRCMDDAYKLDVPLKVDIETGDNWYDAK